MGIKSVLTRGTVEVSTCNIGKNWQWTVESQLLVGGGAVFVDCWFVSNCFLALPCKTFNNIVTSSWGRKFVGKEIYEHWSPTNIDDFIGIHTLKKLIFFVNKLFFKCNKKNCISFQPDNCGSNRSQVSITRTSESVCNLQYI